MGIVNSLSLPKDAVLGLPIITAIGKTEIYIQNFKSIMEYDSEHIKLMSKKGMICIYGCKLYINLYNEEEIHIVGNIISIEL